MTCLQPNGFRRQSFLILFVVSLLVASVKSGFAQVKASIPTEAQQKEKAKVLEEIHKLSRLETSAKKQEVVKDLVKHLRDQNLPPIDRYVVLTTLIALTRETGDFGNWLDAINGLIGAFDVDARKEKQRLLVDFLEASKSGLTLKPAAVDEALAMARVAAQENRYADANSVLTVVEAAVRRSPAANNLVKVVTETRDTIAAREKDWKAFQAASTKLAKNVSDPAANFTVGRWHLLYQSDWKTALPFLAKVSDASWKAAAELELTAPLDAMAQADVGDAWWKIGLNETGTNKAAVLLHVKEWYARAQPNLPSSLKKQAVIKRLDELAAMRLVLPDRTAAPVNPGPLPATNQPSPTSKPGEWIDLLEWSEGVDWATRGIDWNSLLVGPPTKNAITLKPVGDCRFPLPAIIDGDYDMEVEFTRHGGFEAIATYFPIASYTFRLELSGPGTAAFVQQTGGKVHGEGRHIGIANNQPHRLLIQVRQTNDRASFKIALDGNNDFMKWEGPQSEFVFVPGQWIWQTTMLRHPWVGSWNNHISFHKFRVHMVTGSVRRDTISNADREQDRKNGFIRLVGEKAIAAKVGWGPFLINQIPVDAELGAIERIWPLLTRDFQDCDDFYGAHAPSQLKCPIPSGAKSFSVVGYNDTSRLEKYLILIDGKQVYDSGLAAIAIAKVNIPPKSTMLELVADPAGDSFQDHTYWCYPRFHSVTADKIVEKMLDDKPGPLKFSIASGTVGVQTMLTRNQPINTLQAIPVHFRNAFPCDEFLFAHAPSTLTYEVPEGMSRFTAIGYNVHRQQVKYQVWADGKRIYESPKAVGIDRIDRKLPPGTKTIELKIDDLGSNQFDRSMWCYPRLHRK